MAASKHRSLFFTVLRAAIGISLAAYVIFRILRHAEVDLASAFAQCKWSLIALAFLFYVALLAMTIRAILASACIGEGRHRTNNHEGARNRPSLM